MAGRETGTVKKWNDKGFGFIRRDLMGDSIFVHASDTTDRQALVPGSKVSFTYEADAKGGKAREVVVEDMAEAAVFDQGPREMGTIKRWNADKGFGFIGRINGEADAFFHKKDFGGFDEPYVGQAVSFVFGEGPKGAAATKVEAEEGGYLVEDEREREMGTVQRWNAEKGFGFIGRTNGEEDAFFHKKSFIGNGEPYTGQAVSFVFEEGSKGAAAVNVREEEGGIAFEQDVMEEEEREMGKVKTVNEEKGFAFIVRCLDATEIFGHKREFADGVEPRVGQPVSFVYEVTEKGGTAKKIHEEDRVPPINYSDEGRDFGTIKNFNQEKGFGFIIARKDGEEVRFFEKALSGLKPIKNTCVSYDREEGEKGALAKDLREEDPDRVARVTARLHYGQVVKYSDPPPTKPNSGFGFIVELDQLALEKPKRHYFHMSEIETPDEKGGIDMDTGVSFIIIPAKKGTQAASVTIADPPKENPVATHETTDFGTDGAWGAWGESVEENKAPADTTAGTEDGAWGSWGDAVEEEKAPADKPTADAANGAWGEAVQEEKAPADKATADTEDGAWGDAAEDNKAPTDNPTIDTADGAWGDAVEEEKTSANKPTTDTADTVWGEPVTEEAATPGKDNDTPPETAMEELRLTDTNEQNTAATEGEWGSGGW